MSTPINLIQQAALTMLQTHDAFMSGAPCDKDLDRHVTLAACFGAAAYEAAPCADSGTHAMLRAFLLALIDPMHPELDYLRAGNQVTEVSRINQRHPDAAILHAEQQAEAAAERAGAEEDRADG